MAIPAAPYNPAASRLARCARPPFVCLFGPDNDLFSAGFALLGSLFRARFKPQLLGCITGNILILHDLLEWRLTAAHETAC